MKKTYVELFMRLEKNVYKLGDSIPVHVEIRTEGGNNEIKKVTALLVQEAIYTVNLGSKVETQKLRCVGLSKSYHFLFAIAG